MGVVAHNVQAFAEMKRQASAAARGAMMPEIRLRVRAALLKQVADEFRLSFDPYGKAWAGVERSRRRDRRARGRRVAKGLPVKADKPLVDTGRMRASVVANVEGDDIRVAIPVAYASYHQDGTRFIARRPMLPDARGLPPRWLGAINKEALAVMTKFFGPAAR